MDEVIGPPGLSQEAFNRTLTQAEGALEWLREAARDETLPLLAIAGKTDDFSGIAKSAAWLADNADHVVVLGTGGSSLGGQSLAQVAGWHIPGVPASGPELHFLDNLDPLSLSASLETLPLEKTKFLVVSKSGGTGETLIQCAVVLETLNKAGLDPAAHVRGLTEPAKDGGRNTLRERLSAVGATIDEHVPGLGGRYAALSNVGLIPAAIMGLDPQRVRAGAAAVLKPVLEGATAAACPAAVGASVGVALARTSRAPVNVLMAYADRLERFTRWWVQLWAESLGKKGRGMTPVAAVGPVDQHSQLQLYLDGPNDKLVTFLMVKCAGTGPEVSAEAAKAIGFDAMGGRTVGDFVWSQQRATADTLEKACRLVRRITLDKVDAEAIGALMMHFMLETIIAAHLLRVDAFDQPAVEDGKVLAKEYLAKSGAKKGK
ncbi:MAG: glucose-6-phosphate isomerase [Rhodobiaceae bacterium]|nr:glucose-6-phosphate isomerase [Rhodobiaceae bacterium]MCC0049010.1 glucose-6-phosphate isomerase [Rhodobiaceae bacterium]